MGQSEKRYSLVKAFAVTFWATFGKLGLLFISTSGHTGSEYSTTFKHPPQPESLLLYVLISLDKTFVVNYNLFSCK